jgi:hypothetical protein
VLGRDLAGLCLLLAMVAACGATSFSLGGLTPDASHTCPAGVTNAQYDLHVTVAADNPTSQNVTILSAAATMVVAGVHGQWREAVGSKYDVGAVFFSPTSVGANSKATLELTIPSACTNTKHQGVANNYADYTVEVTVLTSAGTFKLTSQNPHRIVAP